MSIDATIGELTEAVKSVKDLMEELKVQMSGIGGKAEHTLDTVDKVIAKAGTDVGQLTNVFTDRASQVPDAWLFYLVIVFLMLLILLMAIFILSKIGFNAHEHVRSGKRPEKIVYEDEKGRYYKTGTPRRLPAKRERALRQMAASGDLEKSMIGPPGVAV